jgi:hypothetical protein
MSLLDTDMRELLGNGSAGAFCFKNKFLINNRYKFIGINFIYINYEIQLRIKNRVLK